uniref:FMRFamide-like neuropeptide GNFFRF-amide n=1 Tax=Moniezia expansa TaxID=28841 RepID=FARP_MONEX|nr:RecName: Full=FMRFamide-like neuropeptide GNFFRF-amide [Moniezia expansa]AAB27414.1 FMRFamide-immunoreactive peptide [Moniezia expansa=tapeworms, Peptide, 6 aa] [Moniezia expansa]
GNFFRF